MTNTPDNIHNHLSTAGWEGDVANFRGIPVLIRDGATGVILLTSRETTSKEPNVPGGRYAILEPQVEDVHNPQTTGALVQNRQSPPYNLYLVQEENPEKSL